MVAKEPVMRVGHPKKGIEILAMYSNGIFPVEDIRVTSL